MNRKAVKEDLDSRIFDAINITLLVLVTVVILVPLWNVIISSLSSGRALAEGGFIFWSKEFSMENYRAVFRDSSIWQSFLSRCPKR